jgi:hypothetical protein
MNQDVQAALDKLAAVIIKAAYDENLTISETEQVLNYVDVLNVEDEIKDRVTARLDAMYGRL